MLSNKIRIGLACAVAAQVTWGLLPIYVHCLQGYNAFALVAHRVFWSFVLLASLIGLARFFRGQDIATWKEIRAGLKDRKTIVTCLLAALLILANWLGFIWAVLHEHKVDASLGYYICPQVVVILGVIFQGERLTRVQWGGFAVTAMGVMYMFTSSASMPSISLIVAFSFGVYALLKKRTSLSTLSGLTFETGILFVPALLFFVCYCGFMPTTELATTELATTGWMATDKPTVFTRSWQLNMLLICSGLATVAPLAMYAKALKYIPLATVGLLQFIGPTIQFLIGTFLYQERFDRSRLIGVLVVWLGVGIYLAATYSSDDGTTVKRSANR